MKKATKPATSKSTPAQPVPVPAKLDKKPTLKLSADNPAQEKIVPKKLKKSAPTKEPRAELTSSTQPPIVKGAGAVPFSTKIVASVDVGFGNSLYIRGEGPGLSWENGVLMECVADDRWVINLPESSQAVVYKVLLNDLTWCAGDDFIAQPGTEVVVTPTF